MYERITVGTLFAVLHERVNTVSIDFSFVALSLLCLVPLPRPQQERPCSCMHGR